jgi:hypothetical protein
MSQIDKLDYEDKTDPVAVTNRPTQATSDDFNEIKEVVNNCVDGINWIKCDEVAIAADGDTVAFLVAYPDGVAYFVTVLNCINDMGYKVAHTISNKSKIGFDVNVSEACTMVYLTAIQR